MPPKTALLHTFSLSVPLHLTTPSPLNLFTSLSISFIDRGQEVFVERITYRELDMQDNGDMVVLVEDILIFRRPEEVRTRVGMFVVS
jgi:hypothetical protein